MPNVDAPSSTPGQPGNRFCTECGTRLLNEDRFCPSCGADVAEQAEFLTERLRSTPEITMESEVATDDIVPVPTALRRRRRKRRPWYRRPLIVVPVVIVACLLAIGGVLAFRTYSAINAVQSLSTPPPEVSSAALGVENGDAVIDTGPAQEALRQREESRAQSSEARQPVATEAASATGDRAETTAEAPSQPTNTPAGVPPFLTRPSPTPDPQGTEPVAQPSEPVAQASEPLVETPGAESEPTPDTELQVSDGVAVQGVNILLMGVDARENEAIDVGVRPDSLAVLNLNKQEGTCRILAIPRDSRVNIPGYGMSKVNHALAVGGIPFEMLVLEDYLGITFDHYALIDFEGLVKVVDAFGGVNVDNGTEFTMDGHYFAEGEIHLDGERALLYARYRGGSDGDFGRVENQQQIVRSLVDSANRSRVISLIPDSFELLQDNFRTDFGVLDLVDLANTYLGKCTGSTVEGRTIPGDVATLFDDMMQMDLSFVVSSETDVLDYVHWLQSGETGTEPDNAEAPLDVATPDATQASTGLTTPGSTEEATPPPQEIWRQDQGW